MVSEHPRSLGIPRLDSIMEEINRKHELVISIMTVLVEGKSSSKEKQQEVEDSVLCYGSNSAEIREWFADDTTEKSRGMAIDVEGEELSTSVEKTEWGEEEAEEEDMEISVHALAVMELWRIVILTLSISMGFRQELKEFKAENLDRNIKNKVAKRNQKDEMIEAYATLFYLLNPRVVKRMRQLERMLTSYIF